ncbi:hypothetical protein [Pseudoclavibacter sp. VKM Ac-2888]|uniref:hypothetical protein n=1 Tax=Pseudoclavibacter sp. VKM Ac-2888 TaxID=2783830 RepID=UPI00188AE460|nr:hypothetical protein [Pseudoclavibacter sp. VKM Ac-2888]MBF4549213.1 hypothetical protein [Pseudoclavibacter sp. VKM Ac-2888]
MTDPTPEGIYEAAKKVAATAERYALAIHVAAVKHVTGALEQTAATQEVVRLAKEALDVPNITPALLVQAVAKAGAATTSALASQLGVDAVAIAEGTEIDNTLMRGDE